MISKIVEDTYEYNMNNLNDSADYLLFPIILILFSVFIILSFKKIIKLVT